ncbi:glycerol acyltransferase [Moraxella caviae]|uniref:1-acyl-sn-glycerol-3-phosphate acyltransferase n=1 Tax=Moraxella caviae TaxID=34060 RepID=A0A1S9ZWI2_9GAMM|nr:1-acyl-sn-glycerol-3-phosphate acyltransferase [Moraxella caviae]OOR87790.1 glycerol acyltransferase [Moraxella caviae]STZ10546.1 1-acyl-sn-glycerol-3-phosphate acyltransferase [Moraxella caviae]VEW11347.1 1-acyl-sn-glycerol-3-phosphate acyltransferase [Moraxella caviae]
MTAAFDSLPALRAQDLGDNVPKRQGEFARQFAKFALKFSRWRVVGSVPNITQAVVIGAPHTSNMDGVVALPLLLALGIDIRILGKKQLFAVPILAQLLRWAGVVPIDRSKKGSVLQASIERFHTGKPLFLGLSPEGTRHAPQTWRTGFYYLALGAGVPIIPVALDYQARELRFMPPFYPTGDIEADMPKIQALYHGVTPKHLHRLSAPLKRLNS